MAGRPLELLGQAFPQVERLVRAAEAVLNDGHEHTGNGWFDLRDHDKTLDDLRTALKGLPNEKDK